MTSQYGAYVSHAGLARLHVCTYTCSHAQSPTHAHMRACAHKHRQICNAYCFSTATVIPKRASVLCYMYIDCLVVYNLICTVLFPMVFSCVFWS
jgi:hypothetical protein